MSYCRWSSDNWRCDLYAYADAGGGWTVHVAWGRRVGEIPDDRARDFMMKRITAEEYSVLHREQMDVVGSLPVEAINLPHAGEEFHEPTLEKFKERLLYLRGLGYNFPDYVLDEVDQDIIDANGTEKDDGRQ